MFQSYLCSPGRMGWIMGKPAKGCVFCKVAKGDRSVPSKVLYKGERFMVILNIYPYNAGHLQVLPVRHVKEIGELDDTELSAMFVLVKRCTLMLKEALQPLGFNIGINQGGDAAGGSIEHLHIHIVPRYRRDFGFMEIIGGTKCLPISLDDMQKKLKPYVKMLDG